MADRVWALLLTIVLLAVSGCGSTAVDQFGAGDLTHGVSPDGLGSPLTAGTGAAASTGAGPTGGTGTLPSGLPAQGSTAASRVSSPGADGGTKPGPETVRATRSVTTTTVAIGLTYQAALDAANRAVGGEGISSGDQVAEANLLVKDINAHGGLAGRRVDLRVFAYDAQSAEPYDAQDQAACSHFTQDVPVFAVIGAGLTSNFQQCMEAAGTTVIGASIVRFGQRDFTRFPHYYDVQSIELDRLMLALADRLLTDSYFSPWDAALGRPGTAKATVGVVAFDEPRFSSAVRDRLLPTLARGGAVVEAKNVILIAKPGSQADVGPAAAQLQSAVLRFRQNNVQHVILIDVSGGITQVFLNQAASQGYYPRYGMESGSGTQALLDAGIISSRQLAGASGLGWIPTLDLPVGVGTSRPAYSSADQRRCLALMKAGGQSFTSTNAASIALLYCDQFWLLQRAIGQSSAALSLSGLQAAVEALGTRAPAANLGTASYSSGKHFGVARGFQWVFDDECGCMSYPGRTQQIR